MSDGYTRRTAAKAVYAALAGGSSDVIRRGVAPQYGDFVLVLDESRLENRAVFSEGDSMNPMGLINALRAKEKLSDRNDIGHRQLNRQNAELALALYNVGDQLERPYQEDDAVHTHSAKNVQYVEAQVIGGVSMDDV